MTEDLKETVRTILSAYDAAVPATTADALRNLWLQFEPKSMGGIKAEERTLQETAGIPVPVLKKIGGEIARPAAKFVDEFIPLCTLLWDEYGREGRVVATIPLGKMELAQPETIVPLLMAMCRSCYTWEDADRLAMDALEPIVRKDPERWLSVLEPWLSDDNKWVRRAVVTVAGRLPMKQPAYTARCLEMAEELLLDQEEVVKKAVSFAIRICARGDVTQVSEFLARQVPPQDAAATWVLCDVIRSMTATLLPEFVALLPLYERWAADPALSARERLSVESAVKKLKS